MNICFILPTLGVSGGIKVVFEIAEELAKRGEEVNIIYPIIPANVEGWRFRYPTELIKYIIWIPLNLIKFNKKKYEKKYPNVKITRIINLNKIPKEYKLYVATWWETAEYLKSDEYSNVIYFVQGIETWYGSKNKVLETYKNKKFKLVTISKYLNDKIYEVSNRKCNILYNSIDLDSFYYDPKQKEYNSIGIIYRKNKVKNIEAFMEYLIANKNSNLKYYCLGENIPKKIAKQFDRIYDGKSKEEVVKFYNKIGMLIIPSKHEGFSLPVVEAMKCGALVSIKKMGIAYELIEDGINSFFLEDHSSNSIKKVIDRYSELNINKKIELSKRAERTISEKYFNMIKNNKMIIKKIFK